MGLICLMRPVIFFFLMFLIGIVLPVLMAFMLVFSVTPASIRFAAAIPAVAVLVSQAGTLISFCRTIGPLCIGVLHAALAHMLRCLAASPAVSIIRIATLASQCRTAAHQNPCQYNCYTSTHF